VTRNQELKPDRQVDLDFVHVLPEARRIPLLLLLTHTDVEDFSSFREQVRFPRGGLRHFMTNLLALS
jgi:hypothetical protein